MEREDLEGPLEKLAALEKEDKEDLLDPVESLELVDLQVYNKSATKAN